MRLTHRAHRGDIAGKRWIAEPQLDRAEAAHRQQRLGLGGQCAEIVFDAEAATVIGRDRPDLGAEQRGERLTGGDGDSIPAGDVEAGERHAHNALHADQRETARQFRGEDDRVGASRLWLRLSISPRRLMIAGCAALK